MSEAAEVSAGGWAALEAVRERSPLVHVSRTITLLSRGSPGRSRRQIHRARFSLVGFSRPSTSLR